MSGTHFNCPPACVSVFGGPERSCRRPRVREGHLPGLKGPHSSLPGPWGEGGRPARGDPLPGTGVREPAARFWVLGPGPGPCAGRRSGSGSRSGVRNWPASPGEHALRTLLPSKANFSWALLPFWEACNNSAGYSCSPFSPAGKVCSLTTRARRPGRRRDPETEPGSADLSAAGGRAVNTRRAGPARRRRPLRCRPEPGVPQECGTVNEGSLPLVAKGL